MSKHFNQNWLCFIFFIYVYIYILFIQDFLVDFFIT